jgi:hypothetical protein
VLTEVPVSYNAFTAKSAPFDFILETHLADMRDNDECVSEDVEIE